MPIDDIVAVFTPPVDDHESTLAGRSTCPPEELRIHASHTANVTPSSRDALSDDVPIHVPEQQPTPPPTDDPASPARTHSSSETHPKPIETSVEGPPRDIPTPMSTVDDGAEETRHAHASPLSATAPTTTAWSQQRYPTPPYSAHRFLPNSSSSLLRPGSRFKGNQTSDRQQYEVEVEIKYVDMRESFLCGYLRIKGLTEDHPSLTTYFEGEIIGSKYTFITQHPEWGSNEKVDRQHWGRFPAYKPLSKYSSRPELVSKDWMQKEHLFMRWKEYFLVPDHRVKTINGASFEGFYYICFNQVSGGIEGIYFHAKSEKFQKLQLEHVEDHGCQGAIEFR
ncbi:hypothetical protein P171DRAFT_429095 [Karstenula rhodostoma CBS 690.94]|uniref:Vesicle-mediated transport protein Vid24 n=1 Tax=Karstenula rhodostoma CBS 690.94 TaxID=1392251 RepID=A0A9P4UEH6_9PLEO|nr:hypothetical protein P171DRAFT_429095 [Karstenula rhodostoma CBS 690.94]